MSYGFSLTVPAGRHYDESNYSKVLNAFEDYSLALNFGDATDAVRDHIEMAAEAVDHIASVVGVAGETLAVSISGHANVGHAETPAWADEFVSVNVSVKRELHVADTTAIAA